MRDIPNFSRLRNTDNYLLCLSFLRNVSTSSRGSHDLNDRIELISNYLIAPQQFRNFQSSDYCTLIETLKTT